MGKYFSFENQMMVRVIKKNTILHFPEMQDKYVYLLKEGCIKIAVVNKDGKEAIKYLVKPGDIFGEISLLGVAPSCEDYATALDDSVIYFSGVQQIEHWMTVYPELRSAIRQNLGRRIRKAEDRFLSMIFKDAHARIWKFLNELAMEFGRRTDQGYEIKNFLTHDDIAKLTDTSRQTVNRILNQLRDQKLIAYNTEII